MQVCGIDCRTEIPPIDARHQLATNPQRFTTLGSGSFFSILIIFLSTGDPGYGMLDAPSTLGCASGYHGARACSHRTHACTRPIKQRTTLLAMSDVVEQQVSDMPALLSHKRFACPVACILGSFNHWAHSCRPEPSHVSTSTDKHGTQQESWATVRFSAFVVHISD
jgi:hypothetical protein